MLKCCPLLLNDFGFVEKQVVFESKDESRPEVLKVFGLDFYSAIFSKYLNNHENRP